VSEVRRRYRGLEMCHLRCRVGRARPEPPARGIRPLLHAAVSRVRRSWC